MKMSIEAHGNSRAMHRTGWVLSWIVIALMGADAVANLLAIAPVKKATLEIGYPLAQCRTRRATTGHPQNLTA
jgi:hypothetical protein